ncbi:hypothetical protein JCM6882_001659 [Rhodosporidiobolus microsporus]
MAAPNPPPPSGPPPPPPTPGAAPTSRWHQLSTSRPARFAAGAYRWKGLIGGAVAVTYLTLAWKAERRRAQKRDEIHDNTYLYWKIYDGGIVEAKSAGSNLNYLLSSSQGGSPEEPPRVMELFDVVRTIKFIESDDRIRGIIADFSSTSVPSVPSYNLGLAQLEEIQDALLELRRVKRDKFGAGPDGWRTVAWSDTFYGQGQYLLASCFDEVYCQPTGEVPLVGMGSTTPFFGRLAKWLGIDVHAEARSEYKSFVQPYIDEKFTDAQRENHTSLLSDLNDNLLTYIGRNRFSSSHPTSAAALSHTKSLSLTGPFPAYRAQEAGLIDGTCYRQDVLDAVLDEEEKETGINMMGFYHYAKVLEKAAEKFMNDAIEVGVVYLLGTIGDPGEFGTASVIRGLKEAGEDDTIGSVVLRVDSGGGSVIDSDSIGAAVRDLRNKGKTVVASFGNSAASGGYWVATHTDAILAAPSTVTGSIGVAALRPTFLQRFFDRLHLTLDSISLGSRASDPTHSLTPAELERHKAAIDAMYADFKQRVCDGRGISADVIESVAGGRVVTALRAFEMNAPEELIRQIRGLDDGDATAAVAGGVEDAAPASSAALEAVLEKVDSGAGGETAVVMLDEAQGTSPFAVPEAVKRASSALADAAGVENPPHLTQHHTASSSPSSSSPSSPSSSETPAGPDSAPASSDEEARKGAVNGAAGLYEYDASGPYGRGLVDGLGGLRDAAIYACQQFIANGIAGYKLDNPSASDHDAIKTLLPEAKFVQGEDGELAMQVDVRLKRFPVHKSFWQQIADASRRGDSMADQLSLSLIPTLEALKSAAARYFLQAVAESVVSASSLGQPGELDGLRVGVRGTATPGLGAGGRAAWMRGGVRAEWSGAGGGWA